MLGAVGLAPNMVNALILDNIIGFYLPQLNNVEIPCIIRTSKNPDCAFYAEKAGPAFRADVKRYRANLTLSENKFVLFDDANPFAEIADIEREAGSNFDIDTRFVQLVGGLGFSTDDAYVKSSGLVGFAFLEFHKPWSLAYLSGSEGTDGGLMMFSRFRAYGIGQQYRRESIGRAGLVLDTEIFAGLGSVRLADGVDLLEVLAENDLALMALYGGAEVGFHLGLTKGEQRGLHLNALLGGDFDWFFAYSSEGEGDLLSEENETLTFDVRSHGTIELRAMF